MDTANMWALLFTGRVMLATWAPAACRDWPLSNSVMSVVANRWTGVLSVWVAPVVALIR
jgi:hypothetical protein